MPVTRRQLLVGGGAGVGLLIAWAAWPRHYAPNINAAEGETIFNAFLKIGENGHVAVVCPQAEMGQGVYTALPQILADELGADWRTVSVEPAPISPLYANTFVAGEAAEGMLPEFLHGTGGWVAREFATRSALMITGGSSSVRGFEGRLREAGAAARALLCSAAGKRVEADWRAFEVKDGFVIRGDERFRFGDLAAEAARLPLPKDVSLRPVGEGGISGISVPRLDLPSKVDGSARFAADVRLPDMLFASVRAGPLGASRLVGVDRRAADAIPGVRAVIENPHFCAAVATNWWAANRGVLALKPQWKTEGGLASTETIDAALNAALNGANGGKRFFERGDLETGFASGRGIKREYAVPLAIHAPIESLTATARVSGDRLEIWMPTQAPGFARAAAARAINFDEDQVTIYPMLIGGGFGRKIENDAAVQAAIIAHRMGRPVQVVWSRAEELLQDRFRPPARARMLAKLGQGGTITGWQARIAAPAASASMMQRLIGQGDGASVERAAIDGAIPPYAIPAIAIDHLPADIGIGTGIWRSVAHSYTAFFTECFVDELAREAGMEPFGFRIQMLGGNPRLARCLTTVTALGNWDGGSQGSGQGIAAHSSFGSHVAMLVDAHLDSGSVVVTRVTAAVDCGRVINPEIARQQIEGGIIWGLAGAIGATSGISGGLADARNFDALNLPILANAPEIRIELIRSNEAPGGVGEIAVPPVAPAIANALFAATGRRFRTLPLGA